MINEHWFGPKDTPKGDGYFALGYSSWHSRSFPMWYAENVQGTSLAEIVQASGQFVVEGIETEDKRWVDIFYCTEDGRVESGEYDVIRVGIRPLEA